MSLAGGAQFFDLKIINLENIIYFTVNANQETGHTTGGLGPPRRRWRPSTQSSGSKNEDGGYFDLRGRRSKIEDGGSSSIFRLRIEEPPIVDLRSRRSKNSPSSIFGLRPRKNGSKIGRKTGRGAAAATSSKIGGVLWRWGVLRSSDPKSEGHPIFDLRSRKNEEPLIFHVLDQKNEETPPTFFVYRHPSTNGYQLLSAILRFGSSARPSTLEIGPKIAIGPLIVGPRRQTGGRQGRVQLDADGSVRPEDDPLSCPSEPRG